jgi:hypothetical protein
MRRRDRRRVVQRYLELLAAALTPGGWRFVEMYKEETPVLCVYARGPSGDVGIVVGVASGPGGALVYAEVPGRRRGLLWSCGDVRGAAGRVEDLLKHRMSPSTG